MYICDRCGKEFEKRQSFAGHKAWCGRKDEMIYSMKNVHHKIRKMECQYCGKQIIDRHKRKYCSLICLNKAKAEVLRNKRLDKKKYGITIRELEEYRKNHQVCEICGRKETTQNNRNHLAYDHDHKTGQFRGMLCFRCNVSFDYFCKYYEGFESYYKKHMNNVD